MLGGVTKDAGRVPLAVYVMWHPRYQNGPRLAELVFTWLCADPSVPAVRGLGIPVRFRTSESADALPLPVSFGPAARTAVLVLVDDEMVADGWDNYLGDVVSEAARGGHLILPVALTKNAFNLPTEITALNFLRLYKVPVADRDAVFLNRVTHDLCKFLASGQRKVQVFISHSKLDGLVVARRVQRYLHAEAGLADFFDATDIPDGSKFADVIGDAVGASAVLLVVHTDSYGAREWCRLEVLEAKRRRIPIVVLTAMELGEVRSFPYLGNLPVVCW